MEPQQQQLQSGSHQNSTVSSIDEEKHAAEETSSRRSCPWGKLLVGAVLLSIIAFVVVDSLARKHISAGFRMFLGWIETNIVAGAFAFMGVYFVATVCFVPGSILTLGGGFVFGKAAGLGPGVALASSAVLVGASSGAIASFLLGRYLLRDWVDQKLAQKYPIVKALDEAYKQKGFRISLLLRLSPIIPFNAINYIEGVVSIRPSHYALALLGILPGTVLYCFIGATAGSLTQSGNAVGGPVAIASIAVGIVFGMLAVFVVSYYAKKEFNRIVAEQEQRKLEEEDKTQQADDMA